MIVATLGPTSAAGTGASTDLVCSTGAEVSGMSGRFGKTVAGVGAGAFFTVRSILFSYKSSGGSEGNSEPPTWPSRSSSIFGEVDGENRHLCLDEQALELQQKDRFS